MDARKYMAEQLHHYRKIRHLSTDEVGAQLGKSKKTISAWEVGRGQPDADNLIKLCNIYQIKISDLFAPDDTEDPDERQLIGMFRSLPEEKKGIVIQVIAAMV